MNPLRPLDAQELAAWDAACLRAGSQRGLACEAMRCSEPAGWRGHSLVAYCPWPLLRSAAQLAPIEDALANALGLPSLSIELVDEAESGSERIACWRSRALEARREKDDRLFELHCAEPLPLELARTYGAAPERRWFDSREPPLE